MFPVFLILLFLPISFEKNTINVGLLFVKNVTEVQFNIGYRSSAAAILIAEDRIRNEHLLDNYKLNYTIAFDECSETQATGQVVDMIDNQKISVIIGPSCNRPGRTVVNIASYYNIPMMMWGLTTSSELMSFSRNPTSTTLAIDTYSMVVALRIVMQTFNWDEFAFLYSNDKDSEKCSSLKYDLEELSSEWDDITLTYIYQMQVVDMDSMTKALKSVATKGRIIIVCFATGYGFRNLFAQAANDLDLINDEFMYIFVSPGSRGFRVLSDDGTWHYSWEDRDGVDSNVKSSELREVYSRVMFIDDNMGEPLEETEEYSNFSKQVLQRMSEPPFNCIQDCENTSDKIVATYASQLGNAYYAYALALNKSLALNPDMNITDGASIMLNIESSFQGVDGRYITIHKSGSISTNISMFTLNSSLLPYLAAYIHINGNDVNFVPLYESESQLWVGGQRPLSRPICGFTGNECPDDFFRDYLIYTIIVGFLVFIAIVGGVIGVISTIRIKMKEEEIQDQLWQIKHRDLKLMNSKSKSEASQRSFASGPSNTSSKITMGTRLESTNFSFYLYEQDVIAAMKYNGTIIVDASSKGELRQMRAIDHENVNRFIGLCLDGPQILSIWRYCSRGSVADVIQKSSVQMDNFFIISLIKDIANGLSFIHNSFLKYHGYLTSKCCLIDDRWQIKISDYGLECLKELVTVTKKNLLWTAPEYLRDSAEKRTKEGDIYSFGIICSEIVMKTSPFDYENRNEKAEELIYQIKKGGHNPMRPSLESSENNSINPSLIHLIRDCWTEKPSDRPTIHDVKTNLTSMTSGRKENLMDYVFNMLETYAATLEEEVSERTKELVEEKKKSDVLLYRMLPRTVADKLKLGQVIEPETYEKATIFFSDVVKFTALAAKCSPLQVVTLVNDLYTIFDGIIEQHDVYKVETIGDGYLCVSGVPHRNGDEHCRQIARMALDFLSSLDHFLIRHLPMERINLRIGINTGPVVAGVVGLAMPRYCLFGDSVNTASRMESNGKPGRIHLTSEANRMLTEVIGGFETESRGEVIIKGKGVMETFWLIREQGLTRRLQRSDTVPVRSPSEKTVSPAMKPGIYEEYKRHIRSEENKKAHE